MIGSQITRRPVEPRRSEPSAEWVQRQAAMVAEANQLLADLKPKPTPQPVPEPTPDRRYETDKTPLAELPPPAQIARYLNGQPLDKMGRRLVPLSEYLRSKTR